ncbi:hypothetical protein FHR24_000685 [Wenyingzhuangia heitensis]|uniref:PAP2 superfamily protein n=1 Tax=Wenyingzhuangia heitensis TaxID=1487859 RepID=A0ABX0U9U9_9FLAO|nr:hypothetical protein [Wenyingzhuangia heitensis]NIJ44246.1 hypothetical protein [Wenyingzhuangia heitensis]
MDKFYKVISYILHPVFLPSIATGIYLSVLPLPLSSAQKYLVFFIVLGSTLVVPLATLFLLRLVGIVKTNQAETIQERKIPVLLMIANYLFLAYALQEIWQLRELIILAYATAVGLIVTSFMFYTKTKISLHMLGLAGLLGFTLIYGENYEYANKTIALIVALLGGLATARLQLKAHNIKEIIWGISLGLLLPIVLSYFL